MTREWEGVTCRTVSNQLSVHLRPP